MHVTAPTPKKPTTAKAMLIIMRPKHWVKNAFVFAALLFSEQFLNVQAVWTTLITAGLFCIGSSAVYILNDINDVELDRRHPEKAQKRPLASGALSLSTAWVMVSVLYLIILLSFTWQTKVSMVLIAYVALNVAYSYYLKHQPVLDIFTVAFGFVLRVYAGAVALSVALSSWMLVTTLCLALYLAAIKRRQELLHSNTGGRDVLKHYSVQLVERYAEISATGALLFYSLYVMQARPELTMTIPLVLFGLFRYWYVVDTMAKGESPTDIVTSDIPLVLTLGIWGIACLALLYFNI